MISSPREHFLSSKFHLNGMKSPMQYLFRTKFPFFIFYACELYIYIYVRSLWNDVVLHSVGNVHSVAWRQPCVIFRCTSTSRSSSTTSSISFFAEEGMRARLYALLIKIRVEIREARKVSISTISSTRSLTKRNDTRTRSKLSNTFRAAQFFNRNRLRTRFLSLLIQPIRPPNFLEGTFSTLKNSAALFQALAPVR